MRTRLSASTRGVCVVSTRQNDVLFVQHLVMLEAVHQRGRRAFRIAGEKHRGAGHALRRLFLEDADEIVERGFEPARLGEQNAGAAPPRIHHQHHQAAERQRHPAALNDFEHIGRQEGQIDQEERHDQSRGRERRPAPHPPDHDEGHHAGDDHGAGDGDAVSRRQRARRAEQRHQQQHADQQQRIDPRHENLAGRLRRGVAHFEPRQETELDRLAGQRIGAGDHRLARDHGGDRRQHHHRV